MKSKIRKAEIVVLAFVTALAFTFVPVGISGSGTADCGIEKVYAGEGDEDNKPKKDPTINEYVTGLNKNGEAVVGSTLSLSIGPSSITYHYYGASGERYMQWELWNGSSLITKKEATDSDKDFAVPKDAAGKKIIVRIFEDKSADSKILYSEAIPVIDLIHLLQGPSISGVQYSYGFGSKNIVVNLSGCAIYNKESDSSHKYVYTKIVKLWCNGKYIGRKSTDEYKVTFAKVPMKYNANNTVKVQILVDIEGKEISGGSKSYTVPGGKLGKNKVYATKISAKKVSLRWSGADGASGYRILKGNKKVKDVGSGKRKYVVKGKGAGKAKYKVIPFVKAGGKMYSGTSSTAKPKKNQFVTSNTGKPNGWVVEAVYRIKKVSLKGSTYTVTGWGVNRAKYTKLKKFKKIKITLYCDGKKVLSKTIRNKRVNLKPQRSKKMTFRLKGKAGADLANGYWSYSVSVACDPSMLTPR